MPQAPPQQRYQQAPPTQQSSIQIPMGSAPPKVVSTACIYPSQPGEPASLVGFFRGGKCIVYEIRAFVFFGKFGLLCFSF